MMGGMPDGCGCALKAYAFGSYTRATTTAVPAAPAAAPSAFAAPAMLPVGIASEPMFPSSTWASISSAKPAAVYATLATFPRKINA